MRHMISGIWWRYFAIAVQFCVVLIVAKTLSIHDAALYFSLFGVVGVFFSLSGIGIPDGLVRYMPLLIAQNVGAAAKRVVVQGIIATLAINAVVALPLSGLALYMLGQVNPIVLWYLAVWWFAYAGVFMGAQTLVAFGRSGLGSFFAYSSINIGYAITLIPYLLIASDPSIYATMFFAVLGSLIAFFAVMFVLFLQFIRDFGCGCAEDSLNENARDLSNVSLNKIISFGFPILVSRLAQGCLPWVPAWLLFAGGQVNESATYATASRLTVAVTSVVAALRFTARNDIVRHYQKGNFSAIILLNRRVSLVSVVPPVLALAFLFLFGDIAIPMLLGSEYKAAVAVLMVLVFGVFAEAFGGLSDEILKMTGRTRIVLWSLGASLAVQNLLVVLLLEEGAAAVAWATVAAFSIQYVWQVLWLSKYTPIRLIGKRKP